MSPYLTTNKLNPHWFTSVAVTKYSSEHLRRKRVYLSHNLRLHSVLAGESRRQELERTGDIRSAVKKTAIGACMPTLSCLSPLYSPK